MRTQTLPTRRLLKSAAALVAVSAIAFGLATPLRGQAQTAQNAQPAAPAGMDRAGPDGHEGPGGHKGPGGPGGHGPRGHHGMGMGEEGGGLMALMSPRASARLMDTLKLDAAQRSQIGAIQARVRTQMEQERAQNPKGGTGAMGGGPGALHRQMMAALTQPTLDTAAVERLRQEEITRLQQRSQQHVQVLTEMAQVLTPAQRTQLAGLMQARWDRRAQMLKERPSHGAPGAPAPAAATPAAPAVPAPAAPAPAATTR